MSAHLWTGGSGTFQWKGAGGWNWVILRVHKTQTLLRFCDSMGCHSGQRRVLWHSPSLQGMFFLCLQDDISLAVADLCRMWLRQRGSSTHHSSGSLGTGCPWIMLTFWERAALVPDGSLALLSDFHKSKKSSRLQICQGNFPRRSITVTMSWRCTSDS